MSNGIITLTTDFGLADAYVAIMKGVILSIAPRATIVDYTHAIAPGNIAQAAYLLHSGYRYFPPGTTHVAVVDPGVGSDRRAVAIETPHAAFVGPDNGLFGLVVQDARRNSDNNIRIVELTDTRFWRSTISATFHGRDIFAPVAAHVAAGTAVAALGRPLNDIVGAAQVEPWFDGAGLHGTIVHVDRFGNCITDITRQQLEQHHIGAKLMLSVAGHHLPGLFRTYAECPPGAPVCMIGSSEHLELAVAGASAAELLGVGVGAAVLVC